MLLCTLCSASASPFSPPAKPKAPAPVCDAVLPSVVHQCALHHMFCLQTMRQCTHSAPMRMIYFQNDVRFHMIVVHLGEAGVGKSTAKVLSLIADELELAIGGGPLCPCTPPATALRKALARCVCICCQSLCESHHTPFRAVVK